MRTVRVRQSGNFSPGILLPLVLSKSDVAFFAVVAIEVLVAEEGLPPEIFLRVKVPPGPELR